MSLSQNLCNIFLKALNDIEFDAIKPFYETMGKFLVLKDEF